MAVRVVVTMTKGMMLRGRRVRAARADRAVVEVVAAEAVAVIRGPGATVVDRVVLVDRAVAAVGVVAGVVGVMAEVAAVGRAVPVLVVVGVGPVVRLVVGKVRGVRM